MNLPSDTDIDLTLFVACYNEEANIAATLDTVRDAYQEAGISCEILVIDDASTDRSVAQVQNWARLHPEEHLQLITLPKNRGLDYNYIEGAFLGSGKWYRLICGDNVEPKTALVEIFKRIGQADLIVPYHPKVEGKTPSRLLISKVFTALINVISGNHIQYYNGLAVARRRDVMRWHSTVKGFGFQADLVTQMLSEGFTYVEVPVLPVERANGHSKALTIKNLLSVTHCFFNILFRRLSRRY